MVLVSAGLLFVYCLGAIAAPAIASLAMRDLGPAALFWQNGACHAALAAIAIGSLARRKGGGTGVEDPRRSAAMTKGNAQSLATEISGAAGFFMPTT